MEPTPSASQRLFTPPMFDQLGAQYEDWAAIDYYVAEQLCVNPVAGREHFSLVEQEILFYTLAALSRALRDGHTCLDLQAMAEQPLWDVRSPDTDNALQKPWYAPEYSTWRSLLHTWIPSEDEWPVVLDQHRLYLRRYFQYEVRLAHHFRRLRMSVRFIDSQRARTILRLLFPTSPTSSSKEQPSVPRQATLFDDVDASDRMENVNQPAPSDFPSRPLDWQEIAVANAVRRQWSVIAGGPGTGKTTSVLKVLYAMVALHTGDEPLQLRLAAPTGKAAQRLTESVQNAKRSLAELPGIQAAVLAQIPNTATTLHRLLGVIPNDYRFRHHAERPLTVDILLVDEVSMVDLPMMTRLMEALPEHARIIMLGDADQLPSVAAGSVLADMAPRDCSGGKDLHFSVENAQWIEHLTGARVPVQPVAVDINTPPEIRAALGQHPPLDHVVFLTKSHRFSDQSALGRLAKSVIAGAAKDSWQNMTQAQGNIAQTFRAGGLAAWLDELTDRYYRPVVQAGSVQEAWHALGQFRILAATRVGAEGVGVLNEHIEARLRQQGLIPARVNEWYPGRPIMVTQNHYGLGLFNGDIGLCWPTAEGGLGVHFDRGEQDAAQQTLFRILAPGRLPTHETVYAMTIHKTQGSEFAHVAVVLPERPQRLVSRELLYTGITRSKEKLYVWCPQRVWEVAVNTPVRRYSGLSERLFSA